MGDRAEEPGRQVQVLEIQPGAAHFEQVLILAARVLAQDGYEDYALKIAAGYVLHPSRQNDSCYFLLRL